MKYKYFIRPYKSTNSEVRDYFIFRYTEITNNIYYENLEIGCARSWPNIVWFKYMKSFHLIESEHPGINSLLIRQKEDMDISNFDMFDLLNNNIETIFIKTDKLYRIRKDKNECTK